jgi:hypothetical protein
MNANQLHPVELANELHAAHKECEQAAARLRAAFEAAAGCRELTTKQREWLLRTAGFIGTLSHSYVCEADSMLLADWRKRRFGA